MIFVDSNIVIDLVEDGAWTDWSRRALEGQGDVAMMVNLIVVAEISRAFSSADGTLVFLRELGIAIAPLTAEIAHRAGQAHVAYRLAGGRQGSVLADFLIGAHAAVLGATLVTRDRGRFSTYFPELTLITPETEHG